MFEFRLSDVYYAFFHLSGEDANRWWAVDELKLYLAKYITFFFLTSSTLLNIDRGEVETDLDQIVASGQAAHRSSVTPTGL
jgi:hypothetical protein